MEKARQIEDLEQALVEMEKTKVGVSCAGHVISGFCGYTGNWQEGEEYG